MKIYIMVDAEGISGIYFKDQVTFVQTSPNALEEGSECMTNDINACAEACKQAGAEKIYVRSAHGSGGARFCRPVWKNLSPYIDFYIVGDTGQNRFPGLDDCDGVILLGYHAMAGTSGAILEHTMSSASTQNYWINGVRAGEVAVDAGIVGDHGKPVIMVSGDDKICAEAKALMPWVITAEVKKGLTWKGGMLLPPDKAHAIIRDKTCEAISALREMKVLVYEKPIRLKIENTERTMLPLQYAKPYMKIIDGRTYEIEGSTMEEALFRQY